MLHFPIQLILFGLIILKLVGNDCRIRSSTIYSSFQLSLQFFDYHLTCTLHTRRQSGIRTRVFPSTSVYPVKIIPPVLRMHIHSHSTDEILSMHIYRRQINHTTNFHVLLSPRAGFHLEYVCFFYTTVVKSIRGLLSSNF